MDADAGFVERLPGRVPANQSGFYFPGVIRGVSLKLLQKLLLDYDYDQAMNMVKFYVIPKTVINLNLEAVYFPILSVAEEKVVKNSSQNGISKMVQSALANFYSFHEK